MNKNLIWGIVVVVVIILGWMYMKQAPVEEQLPVETTPVVTEEAPAAEVPAE